MTQRPYVQCMHFDDMNAMTLIFLDWAILTYVYNSCQITTNLSWMVRKGTELESSVVSVERVKEYSETAKEVLFTP